MCLLRGTSWVFKYNSTLCPHTVFMCFVWISEQTAIFSLYNINWLVFITETECVYCAVRTGYLTKFILMRPVITGAQILSQAATWEVCCGKIFLSVFRLSPVTVNPQLLRIHFHGNATLLRRTSGRNLGDWKSNVLSETWERWVEMYFRKIWVTSLSSGTWHRGTTICRRGVPFLRRVRRIAHSDY